jgi:hypothetical protein
MESTTSIDQMLAFSDTLDPFEPVRRDLWRQLPAQHEPVISRAMQPVRCREPGLCGACFPQGFMNQRARLAWLTFVFVNRSAKPIEPSAHVADALPESTSLLARCGAPLPVCIVLSKHGLSHLRVPLWQANGKYRSRLV